MGRAEGGESVTLLGKGETNADGRCGTLMPGTSDGKVQKLCYNIVCVASNVRGG